MRKWKWLISLALVIFLLNFLQIGCRKVTKRSGKAPVKVPKEKAKRKEREAWQDFYIYFAHKDLRTVSPARAYPIFKIKADASELTGQIFKGKQIFSQWGCSFSNDGKKVAWTEISGTRQVAIMNTDGTNKIMIKEGIEAYDPVISHEGNTVAFVVIQDIRTEQMKENIAFGDAENPENIVIAENPYYGSSANCPSYDAFGKRLYFDVQIHESRDIFSMDAISGKEIIRHTADRYVNTQPKATPDGEKIIFVSNRSGKNDIYLIANRGIAVAAELDNPEEQEAKDSKRDIFKNQQIYRLTFEGENKDPAISPDGKMIAFSSNRNGNWEIYIMCLDGSKQTRLTDISSDDVSPIWSVY